LFVDRIGVEFVGVVVVAADVNTPSAVAIKIKTVETRRRVTKTKEALVRVTFLFIDSE